MNVALSNKMATQAWQPQSVQPTAPGQSTMAGPQGQWQSSTVPTQSQGMPAPLYNGASTLPPSPSNAVPQFRASNQANPDSLNSPQPQQSSTPPAGPRLPQGTSTSTTPVSISGYVPQAPSFAGPRWPPPPSPVQNSQSGAPAQTGQPARNSQINAVPQLGITSPQGLPGPPVLPPPPGALWHLQHPPSSGPPSVSGPPASPSTSALQESSAGKVPPVTPGAPSLTATSVQAGSSILAVPSVALGPSLPAPSAPPGLAPLSVSQVPVNVSGQPSTPGLPGGSNPVVASSSMPNVLVVPGPLGPPESFGSSASSVGSNMMPAGTSGSACSLVSPTVGSAPPGPPGVSLPVSGSRSLTLPSTVSAASTGLPGVTPPVSQQQQYVPYLSVPPVPPSLPWAQAQPRPFPPFINVPNPFLPPIRPVVPIIAGNTVGKVTSDTTAPLAPPGEQGPIGKASTAEGDKVHSVSSLSGQVVIGQATSNASTMMSINSSIVTESALGSEVSAKVVEVADVWTAHRTPEGIIYYYNSVTGQSTYDQPPGFQGEVDKVAAQPTPVSWEMIGGTGWAMVTTNDAKRYYYHRDTQATSWQVPPEVVEYRKRQTEEASLKLSTSSQHAKINPEKGTVSFSLAVSSTGSLTQKPAPSTMTGSSALDLIKKKLQDSPGLASCDNAGSVDGNTNRALATESGKDKAKDSHAEKSSSESSSDSDDEERGPTKEECVTQFKEMLKEKGIAPFSKWEKELPKIIFDLRFKAIPSHTERRSIFDHYVRTRAEEERKEKRAVQKAAIEGFKQLLEEASKDINHNTDYEKFARKWASDPRFESLERKDRENLLNERVLPLRKQEEERIRAIQSAAAAGFKAMLTELGDITSSSRWSKVKDKLRNDPRYRTVMREEREALFNAFVGKLMAAEQEAERAKREQEERRKELEREKRKRKERDQQEWQKARAKVLKRDATAAYQALLTEKVKDPEASWTESKPKLEKDPLNRATNPELDNVERERLFREHVKALYERALRDYRALLAEAMVSDAASKQNEEGKSMLNSWSEAKKHLKSDPRYGKMPRGDREAWWRRYAEDIQRKTKAGLDSSKEERHIGTEGGKAAGQEGSRRSTSRK